MPMFEVFEVFTVMQEKNPRFRSSKTKFWLMSVVPKILEACITVELVVES